MPTPDSFSLAGQHVLVVGASGGLGQAVARAVADHGGAVTLTSRTASSVDELADEIQATGARTWTTSLDVTDAAAVDRAFTEADARAPLTSVVVLAGVSVRQPIVSTDEGDYRRVLETNLTGSWNCAKSAGRLMIPRRAGRLILFASLASFFGFSQVAAYSASKGAVVQLTKSLAVEWAEHGLLVNAVAPGFIATEMTRPSLEMPERKRWILDRTPLNRLGTAEEVADVTVFLISPASRFVTGQVLYVDGGITAGSQW